VKYKAIINRLIRSDDDRTKNAKIHILYSFGIKGISILTYLLIVPITLNYLNKVEYGIWLTISSILMWVNTFDIGLGNGLRNKLAEAVAHKDWKLGQLYISTCYVILIILMAIVYSLFLLINKHLDWYSIMNIDPKVTPNLSQIINISFVLFCLTFVFKIIGNVYLALQKPAVNNFLVMVGQLVALVIIYLLSFTTQGTLLIVSVVYSAAPLLVYIIASFITFLSIYPKLRPKLSLYNKKYVKDLMSIGTSFFILQIAGLILFSTTNLLISNQFGPDKVTVYNIAYRYFSVVPMLFSIVLAPIWSATTDAYIQEDYNWINKSMRKVNVLLLVTFFILLLMVAVSNYIYKIWIGESVDIPFNLTIAMAIYTYVIVGSLSYSSFLNGIGKLKLQVINTCLVALIFLPLAFGFTQKVGIVGLTVALIIVNLPGVLLNLIQFNKIINGRATGIWNK